MGKLENKVAIVTGAGSGIGAATAHAMAQEGAAVVVADINTSPAQAVAASITGRGYRAIAVTADVSQEADIIAMLDATEAAFGKVDILHNNAGIGHPKDYDVVSTPTEAWDLNYRVNLMGVVLGTRHAIPRMLRHGHGGVILNTSSQAPMEGDIARVAYASAKAALTALTRYVATSHGRQGIRCNAIAPGLVLSEGARKGFRAPAMLDTIVRHQLTTDIATPEDIAALAVFLCSDDARFIIGQTITIDAGISVMGSAVPDLAALMGRPM